MKSSILISSFAALCLLITFAEAPRRHDNEAMIAAFSGKAIFTPVNNVTMLSGPVITAERKSPSTSAILAASTEDFSYLKFDVTEYMNADASRKIESEIVPEAVEADLSYLKFNVSDYLKAYGSEADVITELPEDDLLNPTPAEKAGVADQFGYLRFDVSRYYNESEFGELPSDESIPDERESFSDNFIYLKFRVSKYYDPESLSSEKEFELPEE